MALPTLFDVCTPREDVRKGLLTEADFAADLAQVLRGDAPEEYLDPVRFFANTHPTRGLRNLLFNVCGRLRGDGGGAASIFRLDTNYGGGKTHALIALSHAARGMPGVQNVDEFIDPALLPAAGVRIAAFDGENADPANGRSLGNGLRAYTPWGEIAHALAGGEGYARVRKSDENGVAPGAGTIRELFGDAPALILIDELSVYLRKLKAGDRVQAGGQLTAFLTGLFKAVEATPNAALVYTLAIGKDKLATDAYSDENQFIAECMEEAESVSARKATLLDPTEEDETVRILRRRLFTHIDDDRAGEIVKAYRKLWEDHREHLPAVGAHDMREEAFRDGYPLHPELIQTLKEKTATLINFQRVRGMLRLLARTVQRLWADRPSDAYAVHLHHIDPAAQAIRQEIVTKLGQRAFVPALKADIAAVEGDQLSLAQELDAAHYIGLAPYGSYAARTIFFHTLAFNNDLKGLTRKDLRYALLSPGTDISFIDDAVRRFVQASSYLDDRASAPLRFSTEANLTQMVRRQEKQVDGGDVRAELNDRIKSIFGGKDFQMIPFPNIPNDIPDDAGDGKPHLAVISYDAVEVSGEATTLPDLVRKLFKRKGAGGDVRKNLNNLVFVAADALKKEEMKKKMVRRLALSALRDPERRKDLAQHQQDRLDEWYRRSEQELAVAVQQAYRHVFYPSRDRVEGADVDLGHTVVDVQNASANPGDGQRQVVRVLQGINKMRKPDDDPDSPLFIREKTPLKKGLITTAALRSEYHRNPALPMLVGNDVFVKGIRNGIEAGEFVYRSGDLLCGKGDPWPEIRIDEQSAVMTTAYAKENGIWPPPPPGPDPDEGGETGAQDGEDDGGGEEPGGDGPGPGPGPGTGTQPPPTEKTVTAEAVLKEALAMIWETARSRKFGRISSLHLRVFDPGDGFKLLGPAGSIPKSDKTVEIQGDYETADGSELSLEFKGSVNDAKPIKDFLDPQLRAAADRDVTVSFRIDFTEGLDLAGDEPEKLTERLSKFGTGAVYVAATAEGDA
jgi:hypothetical protein